jgi:acetoacetyl-CoA synthetase
MSGGTDVASAFCRRLPIEACLYRGNTMRTLGCDLDIFDETGHSIVEKEGELVIKQSMPVCYLFLE